MGIQAGIARHGFATGDSSNPTQTTLIQAQTEWFDAREWESGVFTASVVYVKAAGNLTLDLYTASEWDESGGYGGGPHLLKSFGTISSRNIYKVAVVPEAGDWPIEKYVFWKITASGAAGEYQAFFQIDAIIRNLTPDYAVKPGRPLGRDGVRLSTLSIPSVPTATLSGSGNSRSIAEQLAEANALLADPSQSPTKAPSIG